MAVLEGDQRTVKILFPKTVQKHNQMPLTSDQMTPPQKSGVKIVSEVSNNSFRLLSGVFQPTFEFCDWKRAEPVLFPRLFCPGGFRCQLSPVTLVHVN